MLVNDITREMERWAPAHLKEDWDNVGLHLGDRQATVKRVLLALTPSEAVVAEAVRKNADLIITHHPFFFKGAKAINSDSATGRMALACIRNNIALFCAHTNLDIAEGGVNDALAERLGLENVRGLAETARRPRYKVVVFVPEDHLEAVKGAMLAAGAGRQGAYSDCAWSVAGEGQFRPLDGAEPFLGQVGAVERVREARLELLVDQADLPAVLAAMSAAHPYEEVAYDVFENQSQPERAYLGRVGELAEPVRLGDWLGDVKAALGTSHLKVAGDLQTMVRRVALCGGSACEYMGAAKAAGADVYITGDMKYHDAQRALELGIPVVDVSHYAGERPVLEQIRARLNAAFPDALDITISQDEENFMMDL
ncbi:MAG: Nif3-like dinuclear metal center hexameric protein [Peptococcaceae bacterium]|nr:Nif3-like dinuclear metal center hexameric protein [Peptococcaceae bacterium]